MLKISLKMLQTSRPEAQIYGSGLAVTFVTFVTLILFWLIDWFIDWKIRNFDSFGAVFPHFCPCEIWYGGQRVAPVGRKPHFWTTEWQQYRHGCAWRWPAGNKAQQQLLKVARDHNYIYPYIGVDVTEPCFRSHAINSTLSYHVSDHQLGNCMDCSWMHQTEEQTRT